MARTRQSAGRHQTEEAIMALFEKYRGKSLSAEQVYHLIWGENLPSAEGADGMIRRIARQADVQVKKRDGKFYFFDSQSHDPVLKTESQTPSEKLEAVLRERWFSIGELCESLPGSPHKRAVYQRIDAIEARLPTGDRLWRRQEGDHLLFWIGPRTAKVQLHPIQKMEECLRAKWSTTGDLLACWPIETSRQTVFSALGRLRLELAEIGDLLVRRGPRHKSEYTIQSCSPAPRRILPKEETNLAVKRLIRFLRKGGKRSARQCMIYCWGSVVRLSVFYSALGKANRQVFKETGGKERINSCHVKGVRRYRIEAANAKIPATLIALPPNTTIGYLKRCRESYEQWVAIATDDGW